MTETTLNAHSLFFGQRTDEPFLTRLNVPEKQLEQLRSARDKARKAITDGFAQWQQLPDTNNIIEKAYLRAGHSTPKLRPKFRHQGSYAYDTLNLPAHTGQQVDFDDGMFLPISFFTQQGIRSPALTSQGYFYLVEKCLEPLCNANKWNLIKKDCCVRIELDTRSHLDIALYAIPDEEYVSLMEKSVRKDSQTRTALLAFDSLAEDAYRQLKTDTIMLAQRSEGWTESDPRAIEDWFIAAVKTHGPQLRRVSRYIKAWRDFRWQTPSRLSSIILMRCAVDAFDSLRGNFDDARDDAALLFVASRLADYLAAPGGVSNPVLPKKLLNGDWTAEQRTEFVGAARVFHSQVSNAIQGTSDKTFSLGRFIQTLGERIPDDPELILPVTAERLIRAFEIKRTPAPVVVRSRSG